MSEIKDAVWCIECGKVGLYDESDESDFIKEGYDPRGRAIFLCWDCFGCEQYAISQLAPVKPIVATGSNFVATDYKYHGWPDSDNPYLAFGLEATFNEWEDPDAFDIMPHSSVYTVYMIDAGKTYHKVDCRHLQDAGWFGVTEDTLNYAIWIGRRPCRKCFADELYSDWYLKLLARLQRRPKNIMRRQSIALLQIQRKQVKKKLETIANSKTARTKKVNSL